MIQAQCLTKFFGACAAVEEVSFTVEANETVGFLGVNGAGKSTTMRMLTGFLTPTAGTASIGGYDVQLDPLKARRQLGYFPENTPLYHDMRVGEFLDYRARIKGIGSRPERRRAMAEVLNACWLEDMAGRLIGHLSKGYRQRVGLADCLLGKPPLLILDEPTVGLDPNQVQQTRSFIKELGAERTVFLSTHILHEVELICRRVIIIDQGRIVAEGSSEDLCSRYEGPRMLSVQLTAPDPVPQLSALDGVVAVEDHGRSDEGVRSMTLTCAPRSDPRHAIARLVAEKGWLLQEMRLEPVRLEQIFAQLTAPKEEANA